jgi:signal transduction histidine kinase
MPTLSMDQSARLLDAVHLATRKLASLEDLDVVLQEVLQICVEAVGATNGTIYIHEPSTRRLQFRYVIPQEVANEIGMSEIADDFGEAGRVFQTGIPNISSGMKSATKKHEEIQDKTGVDVKNMITVPLQIEGMSPVGVVQIINKRDGHFNEQDLAVLDTITDVSTLAIMHSRLLQESAQVASLQGMGRAAHDLANKAGVLMTFLPDLEQNISGLHHALCQAGVKGEACEYIDRLESSYHDVWQPYTERVYRFARLVNDLAAGKKLEPKKKLHSFLKVVRDGVQYMESMARKAHVGITFDLQEDAPKFEFDDLYIVRIAENLVGNAIKAVSEMIPDAWHAEHMGDLDAIYDSVIVRTRYRDGMHVLEVEDHGPGMSPGTIRRILSGQARSQWGRASGSGLGTKIVLDLAATHGGRVSIDSLLGEGTTFRVEFPETME